MDHSHSSTLLDYLQDVPDPRHKKGQSYEWRYLLALITAAIASGHKNMAAICQWVHEHGIELCAALIPVKGRLPSYATLRRAIIEINSCDLEQQVAIMISTLTRMTQPPAVSSAQMAHSGAANRSTAKTCVAPPHMAQPSIL